MCKLLLNVKRFKNVLFEISATEEPGVFEVTAEFMGVAMEKVELEFQVRNIYMLIICSKRE